MRAKNLFLATVAVVVAAVIFVFAFHARADRHDIERASGEVRSRQAQLGTDLERATQRVAGIDQENARVKWLLETAKKPPVPSATNRTLPPMTPPPELASLRNKLATDPKVQNAALVRMRERFTENYRVLAEQLQLTPEQSAQLVEHVLKRYEQRMDIAFAMETLPPEGSDTSVAAKAHQQIDDAFRAAQVALLGEAAYAKFEAYERTAELRRFVNAFAGKAAIASVPITAVQADGLVEALAAANASFRGGRPAQMQDFDWPAVMTRAEATLSTPQLATFKNAAIPYWNLDRLRELAAKK